jgi:hypothetical protein
MQVRLSTKKAMRQPQPGGEEKLPSRDSSAAEVLVIPSVLGEAHSAPLTVGRVPLEVFTAAETFRGDFTVMAARSVVFTAEASGMAAGDMVGDSHPQDHRTPPK